MEALERQESGRQRSTSSRVAGRRACRPPPANVRLWPEAPHTICENAWSACNHGNKRKRSRQQRGNKPTFHGTVLSRRYPDSPGPEAAQL